MSTSVIVLISSALCLLLFVLLFNIESRRAHRLFLGRVRERIDAFIDALHGVGSHLSIHVGTGAMRLMFHFFVHRLLAVMLRTLRLFEKGVSVLQQRNRRIAKVIRDEQKKTHLHLIAEHKEKSALSDEEKQRLKMEAIES